MLVWVFFCFLVVTYILLSGGFQSKEDKVITSFPIKVIQEELITDSRTKWNRVSVYQKDDGTIIVNTYSENDVDIPNQYVIKSTDKITSKDVTVNWETMGNVEPNDDNQVVAQIRITHGEQILFNHKETFTENMFKTVKDVS